MWRTHLRRTVPLMTCCLFVVVGVVLAQSGMMAKRNVIAERKQLMKNSSGNFKDAKAKAKDGQLARIAINAQTMAINARHIPLLYPEGSMGTEELKTRAKLEIWQDWEGFTAAAKQLQNAAMKLSKLTKDAEKMGTTGEQVAEAFKAVGGACKNCHKKFRVPKKKK